MATVEQKIAQKEAELARLKEKKRKLENAQKIVIGGMMLSMAKGNPIVSKKLLDWINEHVDRKTDLNRLESVIDELQKTASSQPSQPQQPVNQLGGQYGH
ncbi:hypothetical protein [Psychrobacter phenylpyruvicus]|uniref:Mobilization protein C n=1 Tax=Psychrobacter phenylpyruvicus TaxID=29432 RepID=A0A379LQY6_9GAMM|nr:hypothetical protein [Psychrobacter phenylpyruvicus]SUD98789.1 Uncharacterised protein [Psychrobacter phenylpyruvicus]